MKSSNPFVFALSHSDNYTRGSDAQSSRPLLHLGLVLGLHGFKLKTSMSLIIMTLNLLQSLPMVRCSTYLILPALSTLPDILLCVYLLVFHIFLFLNILYTILSGRLVWADRSFKLQHSVLGVRHFGTDAHSADNIATAVNAILAEYCLPAYNTPVTTDHGSTSLLHCLVQMSHRDHMTGHCSTSTTTERRRRQAKTAEIRWTINCSNGKNGNKPTSSIHVLRPLT